MMLMMVMILSIKVSYAADQFRNANFSRRICGNVGVQNVSNYFQHYSKVIDYMQDEMSRNRFAFKEVGDPPDRLYVLSQCVDDSTARECDMCFSQISSLIPTCFPNTGARVYFDTCFIRADNYSFYRDVFTPQDSTQCGENVSSNEDFKHAVRAVLNDTLQKAPKEGPILRGFAVQRTTIFGSSAYGMGTCWKILDQDLCATCLSHAVQSALSCLPSTQARVLNAGCFLRYADFAFAKETSYETRKEMYSYVSYAWCVAMVSVIAITVGLWFGRHTYHRNNIKNFQGMEDLQLLDEGLHFLQFKHAIIQKATANFSDIHKLGEGGFGQVYQGTLPDGREIAVKRLYVDNKNRIQEICNEMDIISRAQHRNLVRFLGCCFTSTDCFLVYEYLANKSLDLILFDQEKKKELSWEKRLLIITGTAEGLKYLHLDCQVRIIHRDIKASNILLDLRYKPKISDFGLARFHSRDHSLINTAIAGTFGYIAPEYITGGRLTEKVDVYSFGVLVIEIVTGVENIKHDGDLFNTVVGHAWEHFQSNTLEEIIDKSMEFEIEKNEEIKRVIQIGLLCTQESPDLRPRMSKVVEMLRNETVELGEPSNPPYIEHMENVNDQRRQQYQQTDDQRTHSSSSERGSSIDYDETRREKQLTYHRRHSSAEHHEQRQVIEFIRRRSSEMPQKALNILSEKKL
ncbi:Cysteine-rich receptor-like protein kinase 46 [Euphorbia peplus]|nr:Cysteine-rich receptor-like protein kinase 46 [Euphorbia peplus]